MSQGQTEGSPHLASGPSQGISILVMDEPASNLDPRSRRQLINLLRSFEHTKVVASHDLDLILDVCTRCIVIREGRVAADGPAGEVLSDQVLLEDNNLELPLSLQKPSRCCS